MPTGPTTTAAPTHARDLLQDSYTLLQDVFRGATELSAAAVERALAEHRELVRQTRELLRALEQAEDALYDELHRVRQRPGDGVLRGARLAAAAVEEIRRGEQPVHYRDLYERLREGGHRVGGRDPLATLLVALSRAAGVERVGERSGLYRIGTT